MRKAVSLVRFSAERAVKPWKEDMLKIIELVNVSTGHRHALSVEEKFGKAR